MPIVKIFSPVRPFSILCEESDSVSEVIRKICRRHVGGTAPTCKLFLVPLTVLWQGFEDSDEAPLCADREIRDVLAELSPTYVLYLRNEACSARQKALPLENDLCQQSPTHLTERLPPLGVHLLGSKGSVKPFQTCGASNREEAQCNLPRSAFDSMTVRNSECSVQECAPPLLTAVCSKIESSLELKTSNNDSDTLKITIESGSDEDVVIVGVDGPEHPVTAEHVLSVLIAEQSRCLPTHTWDINVAMRKLRAVFGKSVDSAAMRELVVRNVRSAQAVKAPPPQPYSGVLDTIQCCGMTLTLDDLHTLEPSGWLNDQIINCYLKLILKSSPSKMRTFAVSTFFYSKLVQGGYRGIRKWLKGAKMNMLRLNLLLVPIHTGTHWSLAAIFAKKRRIEYYDSLGLKNNTCVKRLQMLCAKEECGLWKRQQKRYLNEHPCSVKSTSSRIHWKLCYPKGIPTQDNWSDCGVFVCQFARYLVTGWPSIQFPFSSRHMSLIRRTMQQELRTGRLVDMNFQTHTAD
ncbi:hypothetical protein EMCRGX_G027620 [Ephydatia muelleri]